MSKSFKLSRLKSASDSYALETLEPRLLYSADAAVLTGLDVPVHGIEGAASFALVSGHSVESEASRARMAGSVEHTGVELVIVDRSVAEFEWLAAQLKNSAAGERVVAFIDPEQDGLSQVSQILSEYQNVPTVRLFSHGQNAELLLGNTQVDQQTLLERADEVAGWESSLSRGADLLIYGCDLAGTPEGRSFAALLGQLVRADVAASSDVTGAAALGGDWDLEFTSGTIESDTTLVARALDDYAQTLATYSVSNVNDSGAGSLRQAIIDANASGDLERIINIDISAEPDNKISLLTALDAVSVKVVIEGGGAEIDGASVGSANALEFVDGSQGSALKNLVINNFDGNGIKFSGTENIDVTAVYIGLDASEAGVADSISDDGILIENSQDIRIGDGTVSGANTIVSSGSNGIRITGSDSLNNIIDFNYIGAGKNTLGVGTQGNGWGAVDIVEGQENGGLRIESQSSSNQILNNRVFGNSGSGIIIAGTNANWNRLEGNDIGYDAVNDVGLPNAYFGVYLKEGAANNTIGSAGVGNVISGNLSSGLLLEGLGTDNNMIQGNFIGLNSAGSDALPNGDHGIELRSGVKGNTIGGADVSLRNIISGNSKSGISLASAGTSGNVIANNYIGTTADGISGLGNGSAGVSVKESASSNLIGTGLVGEGNLISGNGVGGVSLDGTDTLSNQVLGNIIGLDATGTAKVSNVSYGVAVKGGAKENIIGGAGVDSQNIISGNQGSGVFISAAGTSNNIVAGNYIGTSASGAVGLGNSTVGVNLINSASNNYIGTGKAGEGNLISGNGGSGIYMEGSSTDGNHVYGNIVGLDHTGTVAVGNRAAGIYLTLGVSGTQIGGSGENYRNVISGNSRSGIELARFGTDGNTIVGNYIGTSLGGADDLGNGNSGVYIRDSAKDNFVGSGLAGEGNIISGNQRDGIRLLAGSEGNNHVLGNIIGLDYTGTLQIGNEKNGISLLSGASENIIGGAGEHSRNTISGNGENGILFEGVGVDSNRIMGNYIGTSITGNDAIGNATNGVVISDGAAGNYIGTGEVDEGNLISGNLGSGVYLVGGGSVSRDNHVYGNIIGLDHTGTLGLGNNGNGVNIINRSYGNHIGGAGEGSRNIISGNGSNGVALSGNDTYANNITGNYIGTSISGSAAIGNAINGVSIQNSAHDNYIGSGLAGEGNVISGNYSSGVSIAGELTDNNHIIGNIIGLDYTGSFSIENWLNGIYLVGGVSGTTIGGSDASFRNVISGNGQSGIQMLLFGTTDNTIIGNYIGTSSDGKTAVANGGSGVYIRDTAAGNHVGSGVAGEGNLISGNDHDGVRIIGVAADNNWVQGNIIGMDSTGAAALGNQESGIGLYSGASGTTIGGAGEHSRNLISGNVKNGIVMNGSGTVFNNVLGNYIGTSISGLDAFGNGLNGVLIDNYAGNNQIGSDQNNEGNVISGNGDNGVMIMPESVENSLFGNLIGLAENGLVEMGNGNSGVFLASTANILGGAAVGQKNTISANRQHGVLIIFGSDENTVQGNYIGTDSLGAGSFGNGANGIKVEGKDNKIGGVLEGQANTISGNSLSGVRVQGLDATDNALLGNSISDNDGLAIDLDAAGVDVNDAGDADTGANNLQNYPDINSAVVDGSSLHIELSLNSAPSTQYRIEVYVSATAGDNGNGEAQRFLMADNLTTDSSGNAVYLATLLETVVHGEYLSATATVISAPDTYGDTSELSMAKMAIRENENPVFVSGQSHTVSENSESVVILQSSDPDGDPRTYAIVGGVR